MPSGTRTILASAGAAAEAGIALRRGQRGAFNWDWRRWRSTCTHAPEDNGSGSGASQQLSPTNGLADNCIRIRRLIRSVYHPPQAIGPGFAIQKIALHPRRWYCHLTGSPRAARGVRRGCDTFRLEACRETHQGQ